MSYTSLSAQVGDPSLNARVQAAAVKEAYDNPELGATDFGAALKLSASSSIVLMYPVSIDTEAAYEYALSTGKPDPGGDPTVITDGAILSAVQAHWPADAAPAT
jgi:hypothetical protein